MTEKRFILIMILCLIFLSSVSVCYSIDITVQEKHIIGNAGEGIYGGELWILTDTNHADYLVDQRTYYHVKVGEKITLSEPDRHGICSLHGLSPEWW